MKKKRMRERKSVILVRWDLLILICLCIVSGDGILNDTKKENVGLQKEKCCTLLGPLSWKLNSLLYIQPFTLS